MKTFFQWLRSRVWYFALFAAFFAVLGLLFYLYRLSGEIVIYGFALCAALGLIFCAGDFAAFRRRHRALRAALEAMPDVREPLPAPSGQIDGDYGELVSALRQENARLRSAAAVRREDMDDYYTLWAHQIKTPIAAMGLISQSAGETLTAREKAELETELFRTEQYVALAMSYQKLSGDGSDFVIARCPLDGVIRQAVHKYARQFIRKGLTLRYEPVDVTVLTDEKWLQFVLEQLLSNALKYTRAGGISIYLRDSFKLVIEDTGIGIAPEDLPRIFEKGFTGYNGRADKKSTGIGLYLCRRILARLGHTIWAESVPGRGTKVILDLAGRELEVE